MPTALSLVYQVGPGAEKQQPSDVALNCLSLPGVQATAQDEGA